jgi:MOSC domain-containing protein YiiM
MGATPIIASIQIGRSTSYAYAGGRDGRPQEWRTAFFKQPVAGGRVVVGSLGLAGDEQADRQNHGGLDKAVLAYSADHYDLWRAQPGFGEMQPGAFGENLTIAGLAEPSVCLGDRWRAGSVLLEVSQPRQPCWKMGRRWQLPQLPKQVIQNGRTGWYLRVALEGELAAGDALELVSRPYPAWTIERANRLFYHERDAEQLQELANLPALSAAWREAILERLSQ